MREWRRHNPRSPEQLVKSRVRSYTKVYIRRGAIRRLPCQVCGEVGAQVHHPDYSKPLVINWLCKPHHLAVHAGKIIAPEPVTVHSRRSYLRASP